MKKLKWLPFFMLLMACVDRIEFQTGAVEHQLVVEGVITDEPGPYKVIISNAFPTSRPERTRNPVRSAQVDLFENNSKIATLNELDSGVYETPAGIRGQVGKTYHIVITTADGRQYSSQPELMQPPGTINEIYYEFESVPSLNPDSLFARDRFNVYVDATPPNAQALSRWKLSGTYKVEAFPHLAIVETADGTVYKAPLRCSGMAWDDGAKRFVRFAPCTCCFCWIPDQETIPHVENSTLRTAAGYRHVKVGEVKVNPRTFYQFYHAEVQQFTISKDAHEFFRLVEAQALGAGSLFQPSFGEIRGNIVPADENYRAVGLFWAASVTRKSVDIQRSEVPYKLAAIDTVPDGCYVMGRKATTIKPSFWP